MAPSLATRMPQPSSCKLQWFYLFRVERIFPDRRLRLFWSSIISGEKVAAFKFMRSRLLGDAKWMRTLASGSATAHIAPCAVSDVNGALT